MSGKKVVVFGGSGFLGSHVADALTHRGYQVTIFDSRVSSYLNEKQEMIVGDILNKEQVGKAISGASVVYNFAGIASIYEATESPIHTVQANILGNTIIMEECVKSKVKRFVFGSSIYVYSSMGGLYKASKLSCEALIEAFSEQYSMEYTILRYGSLYGPRAQKWNAIYTYIHQALTEGEIRLKGTGEECREYIHVADAATLSVDVLKDEFRNERVTVTGSQILSTERLAEMISEIMGKKIKIKKEPNKPLYHYFITPYSFSPKLGKKLVPNQFVDFGQGILQLIEDEHRKQISESNNLN